MHSIQEAVCYLAIGSNLAEPVQQVRRGIEIIAQLPRVRLEVCSSLYLSHAVGYADQPDFINAVMRVSTTLSAEQLLVELLQLENNLGRQRSFRNAPRVIDLDIILYNQICMHSDTLTLPHPRMHERAFVLLPLLEIAPDLEIPERGLVKLLASHVMDQHITRLADISSHELIQKSSIHRG